MKKTIITFTTVAVILAFASALPAYGQGDLTPPGAPEPTMKTLQQVEPRTPISELPYTISKPGSYYLTTNLIYWAGVGLTAISIETNFVTLDLNGFELRAEPMQPVRRGVVVDGMTNVCIRNGRIRGWSYGVRAFPTSGVVLRDLQVFGNGTGLQASPDAVFDHCVAVGNTNAGIVGSGLVKNCVSAGNGGDGITAGFSTIIDCVSRNNGGTGIDAPSSLVTRCTVTQNGRHGIFADQDAAQVTHCVVQNNTLDGIYVASRSLVLANTVHGTGFSPGTNACIHAKSQGNRIEANHVSNHQVGILTEAGQNLIIRNSAHFNGTNYVIAGGNATVPIISFTAIVTNTNPHANFDL